MTDVVQPSESTTVPAEAVRGADYVITFGDRPEGTDIWQRVPYDAADYGPVTDYATDFDHGEREYNPNAPQVWKELREGGCPVAHSDRYGGMWVPLTHDTVNEVAYDTENFTSRAVVVSVGRPGDLAMPAPIGGAPPITSDPPFHNMARRLLLPAFAPKQIEPWEPEIRRLCQQLLDEIAVDVTPGETVIDAAVQYAQHIPVSVIGRMLGFPAEDDDLFRGFVHDVLERIAEEPGTREGMDDLGNYIYAQVQDHREHPREDLTNFLLHVEIDGQPVNDDIVGGMIVLLLIAGIDTTWSAIGSSLWHLAQHPDDAPAPPRRPRGHDVRARGVPPGVRPRHDGADGRQGHRLPRLPDEEGRLGAAAVPGGEPRSAQVRGPRHVHRRPPGEPPRRVRTRHPPLPRLQPRPAGTEGGHRRVRRPLPALRARR